MLIKEAGDGAVVGKKNGESGGPRTGGPQCGDEQALLGCWGDARGEKGRAGPGEADEGEAGLLPGVAAVPGAGAGLVHDAVLVAVDAVGGRAGEEAEEEEVAGLAGGEKVADVGDLEVLREEREEPGEGDGRARGQRFPDAGDAEGAGGAGDLCAEGRDKGLVARFEKAAARQSLVNEK